MVGNMYQHTKTWHGSVGWTLTRRDGSYCGYVGLAYPCESLEDGYAQALDWLRNYDKKHNIFLVHAFHLEVRYF